MKKTHLVLTFLVLAQSYLNAQDNSASGACYGGQNGTYLELNSQLQAISYHGWSERIELEITGGAYADYGKHVYMIDARGGLNVNAYQYNENVSGYVLKIYDNGNASNDADKYIIGIEVPSGTYKNICVRARELKSRTWIDINATTKPNFTEVSFITNWGFKSNMDLLEIEENVGIGTSTIPTGYKLAVDGKIITDGVKIQLSGSWPDYVFSKNYELKSLKETEAYIKEEGHLPNILSAEEVAQNGLDLGEMNAKLLEKVEELTLHLIDQNKKMESMQKENENFKERI